MIFIWKETYNFGMGEQSKRSSCETISCTCLCASRSEEAFKKVKKIFSRLFRFRERFYTPHEKEAGTTNLSTARLL